MRERFRNPITLVLCLALTLGVAAPAAWADPKPEVYVFGDSLSDAGNLYSLTGGNFPPPPYAGKFSNDAVWTEYLAGALGVPVDNRAYAGSLTATFTVPIFALPGDPPPTYGIANYVNFKYAALFHPGDFPLPGLREQVDVLLADHPEGLNPDALYVVWAGANDFFVGLETNTLDTVLPQTVANIATAVCQLGAAGARHFAVGNLPDIGLTPEFPGALGSYISGLVDDFNEGLEWALDILPQHCAKTVLVLDTAEYLRDIIAAPGEYGLGNVSTACLTTLGLCTNPDEYLFWDGVHPTTVGHAIFADKIRADFCGTGPDHPGLRGRPDGQPPPIWRGVCYGSR